MKKKYGKNICIYLFFVVLFFLCNTILFCDNGDQIWEFGFAHNIANGMIPYKDFNMVVLPMHSFLLAGILKIFGDKYMIYLFFHSLLLSFFPTFIYKRTHNFNQAFLVFLLLSLSSAATYNVLLLVFFFLLFYLEKKNANDYIIGILLALLILTKQSVGFFLLIPSFFLKDKKKTLKRILSIFLVGICFFFYLLLSHSFFECLDYTIFGLFDFQKQNSKYGIVFYLYLLYCILLFRGYRKTKEIEYLYLLCFSTVTIPLFDLSHFLIALNATCILCIGKKKLLMSRSIVITFLLLFCSFLFFSNLYKINQKNAYYLEKDTNNIFSYTMVKTVTYKKVNEEIKTYLINQKEKDVYFLLDTAYLIHLDNKIPINNFSLTLYGNNGYKGTEKLKNEFDDLNKNTIFIIEKNPSGPQMNKEIRDYVKEHSEKIGTIHNILEIYQKK